MAGEVAELRDELRGLCPGAAAPDVRAAGDGFGEAADGFGGGLAVDLFVEEGGAGGIVQLVDVADESGAVGGASSCASSSFSLRGF